MVAGDWGQSWTLTSAYFAVGAELDAHPGACAVVTMRNVPSFLVPPAVFRAGGPAFGVFFAELAFKVKIASFASFVHFRLPVP